MASSGNIRYRVLPDTTPGRERSALAAVYSYVVRRDEQRKAAEGDGGEDDAKETMHVRAKRTLPQS
jgi:hypothetical protein